MACYHPRRAFQAWPGAPISFNPLPRAGLNGEMVAPRTVFVPCAKCLGCLSGKSTEWARRCQHEAERHEVNVFLTLTYSDEHLPAKSWLYPPHHTAFMKALRKEMNVQGSVVLGSRGADGSHDGIRFFMCGEYGTKRGRPHYHYLLFNCGFADARLREDSLRLYESPALGRLWPHGLHAIGEASGASANYVAQYTLAKQRQVFVDRPEPFLRMSLKPGIGMPWLREFREDLQHGYLVSPEGRKGRIPKGYVDRAKREWPGLVERIDVAKAVAAVGRSSEPDVARLAAEEVIHTLAKRQGEPRDAEA